MKFGLFRFKGFKRFPLTTLKPLTVLCGQNSCGKSSVLQSILLLAQSRRTYAARRPLPLHLNGEFVTLGEWDDVCFKGTDDASHVAFEFVCNQDSFFNDIFQKERARAQRALERHLITASESFEEKKKAILEEFESYKQSNDFQWLLYMEFGPKKEAEASQLVNLKFECFLEDEKTKSWRISRERKNQFEDVFLVDKAGLNAYDVQDGVRYHGEAGIEPGGNLWVFPYNFRLLNAKLSHFLATGDSEIYLFTFCPEYDATISFLLKIWDQIRFLGPLREPPKRMYQFEKLEGLGIGTKGEYSLQVLSSEGSDGVPASMLPPQPSSEFIFLSNAVDQKLSSEKVSLSDCLNKWLEYLGLPTAASERVQVPYLTIYTWKLQEGPFEVLLPDVGFGVSQILPILIETLRMRSGELLILEQPEIHLHPNLQAKLGDFLLTMAYAGKYFLVETHSEHLINRLCLRVAQAKGDEVSNLLNILFITKSNGSGSQTQAVEINPYGEPVNWPRGFFDDTDAGKLLEAGLRKRMAEKK